MDKQPTEADCQLHNDLSLVIMQDILKAGLEKGEPESSLLLLESITVGVIGAVAASEKDWSLPKKIRYTKLLYEEICNEGFIRVSCWLKGKKYDPK